ncbi:MAG: hypothetical protein ABDH28_03430 [Brevinematia bacterium]
MMISILSNGFGETVIANKIANKLVQLDTSLKVVIFPLIGNLRVDNRVIVGFNPRNLGSGGRTLHSVESFLKDVTSGALFEVVRFVRSFRSYRGIKLALVVGDPFLLILAKAFLRDAPRIVFNSVYKSELVEKHMWFEKMLIKKCAEYFIPRDRYTYECFRKLGIRTVYFGNPMVDSVDFFGVDYRLDPNLKTLLLLPGSRETTYRMLVKLLYVVESVFEKFGFFNVLCSLSSGISVEKLVSTISQHGWRVEEKTSCSMIATKGIIKVVLAYNSFGDMLVNSDVVLSCAGTATEQSAGYGKPTIMFVDRDAGWSNRWYRRQKILLGDNLKLFDKFGVTEISDEIILLFNNSDERKRRGDIGKKMVEGVGSVEKIAGFLINLLYD